MNGVITAVNKKGHTTLLIGLFFKWIGQVVNYITTDIVFVGW